METDYKKLFYVGIAYGAYSQKGKKLKKTGLPVKKLEKEFSYLLGEGRMAVKKMCIYYALFPQYSGKALITGKPKNWKLQVVRQLLEEVQLKAERAFDCREQLLAQELSGNTLQVPQELIAACLYRQRPFDKICITLPDEGGEREMEQLEELLVPYLPRIRQVVFKGNESSLSNWLEEYLYDEFGIVMIRAQGGLEDMPWLNLGEDVTEERSQVHLEMKKALKRCVSPALALKFLDTAVKNGYNTDVNSYVKDNTGQTVGYTES